MAFYLLHDSEQKEGESEGDGESERKRQTEGAKLVKKMPKAGGRACFSQLFCNGAGRKCKPSSEVVVNVTLEWQLKRSRCRLQTC